VVQPAVTDPPEPAGEDLTIAAVAEHLGKSRWFVSRLIKADKLTAIRVPGRGRNGAKRITRASYLAYLHQQAVPTGQPS
jgi:hypothetical protein